MAMSVKYMNFGRRIVAEDRGGSYKEYVRDTLGSTIALVDQSQTVTDTMAYWPFGEVRARTGASVTPFCFGGTRGYYTGLSNASYVRARILVPEDARWLTVDPLWPRMQAYGYVRQTPVTLIDPSGLQVYMGPDGPVQCTQAWNDYVISVCFSCHGNPACQSRCNALAGAYYGACLSQGRKQPPPPSGSPWGWGSGNWVPVPGVGVVPPPPDILSEPCYVSGPSSTPIIASAPPPPCSTACFDEANADSRTFNVAKCITCCKGEGADTSLCSKWGVWAMSGGNDNDGYESEYPTEVIFY